MESENADFIWPCSDASLIMYVWTPGELNKMCSKQSQTIRYTLTFAVLIESNHEFLIFLA